MESYNQEFIRYCQRFSFIYQKEGKWVGLIQPFDGIQITTIPLPSEKDAWIRIQMNLIQPFLIEEVCNKISEIIALQENKTIYCTSKDINNKYGELSNKNIDEILDLLSPQVVVEPIFNGYYVVKINSEN